MPSLTDKDRHVTIDRRDGEYICFPDVLRADDGRLIVAYNESDKHVTPSRRALRLRQSFDNGKTWGDIINMGEAMSHCPRLVKLDGGKILLSDSNTIFYWSHNNGDTWERLDVAGLAHDMIDRVIDLGDDLFLTTGHKHCGTADQPAIRQAPTEQMVYRSDNKGHNWLPISVIGRERNLVLCEASMVQLTDGRTIALMRENSFVYEPMYLCISDDEGDTWSEPMPTPLIGHRPTMGLIPDGRLLVTYRNVAPDMGTAAWVGTLDELLGDFKVQGRHENPTNPTLTDDGLRIQNDEGIESMVRYALRPMTDPRQATASLEAEVRVDKTGENGCGLRLGVWWKISQDAIIPDIENAQSIAIPANQFNTIRLEYNDGLVTLFVNGAKEATIKVNNDHANTRPIMFGAPYPFEDNSVDCRWKRLDLKIEEPRTQRKHAWNWKAEDGLPDQWALDNILELKNDRYAAAPDFGYSGWTTLEDGTFFCAHHHGGGTEKGYEPLFTSHIMGTWFSLNDFKK